MLRNAVINRTKNLVFQIQADWSELTPQTASAFTTTLHAHAVLTEAYQYVTTARL